MITPKIQEFLLAQEDTFLTPSEKLAVIVDTHHIDHAKLLLSHMTYSRVPVVTENNDYIGTISLREIILYQTENNFSDDQLNANVGLIAKTDVATVPENYDLEDVMRKLIDESFLPVVGSDGEFLGIITRKSILKAVNALVHNFHPEEQ